MTEPLTFHDVEGYVSYTHTPDCEEFKEDWERVSSFLQQQTPFADLDKTAQVEVLKRLLDVVSPDASIRYFVLDFLFANLIPSESVGCTVLPVETLAVVLETTLQHPQHTAMVQGLLPLLMNELLEKIDDYMLYVPDEQPLRTYADIERGFALYLGALLRRNGNKIIRRNFLELLNLTQPPQQSPHEFRMNVVLETAGFDFQQRFGNHTAIDVILLNAEEESNRTYNFLPTEVLTYFHEKGTPITEEGKAVILRALRDAHPAERGQWEDIANVLGLQQPPPPPPLLRPDHPEDYYNMISPPQTPSADARSQWEPPSPPQTPPVHPPPPVPPPLVRPSGTLGAESVRTASPVARTLDMPPPVEPKEVVYIEEPMCYHIIEMEDMSVLQAICQGDVVFKLGNSYIATDKKNLDSDVEDRTTIRFKCNRELDGAPRMRDVDGTEYYLLQLTGNVLVDRQNFGNLLWTPYPVFELVESGTTFPFTASATSVLAEGGYDRSVVGTEVNIVSADHCQAGSDRKLYTVVPLVLKRGRATQGGKKRRKTRRGKKISRRRGRK